MIALERKCLLLLASASEQGRIKQANLKRSLATGITSSGSIGDIHLQNKLLNIHARATIEEKAFNSIAQKASDREREMRWGGV